MARDLLSKKPGGVIVRTVGEELTKKAFKAELSTLLSTWGKVQEAVKEAQAPALVHEEKSGKGIQGKLNGELVQLGSPDWIGGDQVELSNQVDGNSHVYLSYGGKLSYIFTLDDELKEDAKEVIQYFNHSSIRPYLLSGDRNEVVDKYGEDLDFYKFRGSVNPEDKLKTFQEWESEESARGKTARGWLRNGCWN